jgi:CRP/FNR family transcriptional regulator
VVSRQLKEFERRGWVTLERGRVIVTDEQGLRTLSRPS